MAWLPEAVEKSCEVSQLLQFGNTTLNTKPNEYGFYQRKNEGRTGGRNLLKYLRENDFDSRDTLDIVCHSMGFAYALGMIEELKNARPNIKLGGFYIIAPENPSTGTVNSNEFMQVWQYGSDENNHLIHKQDGVAPQSAVRNLENHRAFIPNSVTQGFISSHSIGNYKWIFEIMHSNKGYVTPRK
jgi:hypothetical protein